MCVCVCDRKENTSIFRNNKKKEKNRHKTKKINIFYIPSDSKVVLVWCCSFGGRRKNLHLNNFLLFIWNLNMIFTLYHSLLFCPPLPFLYMWKRTCNNHIKWSLSLVFTLLSIVFYVCVHISKITFDSLSFSLSLFKHTHTLTQNIYFILCM